LLLVVGEVYKGWKWIKDSVEKSVGKKQLEDTEADGRVILKCILKNSNVY
jgi:hypothetical protein